MAKYTISYLMCTAFCGVFGFILLADIGAAIARVGFACFLILFLGSLFYKPERRRSEI